MCNTRITEDPRIDPPIKAVSGAIDLGVAVSDAESREQVLKEANTEQAIAVRDLVTQGRHRGASALAHRNPVCRVTALLSHPNGRPTRRPQPRSRSRSGDSPRNPVPGLALLGRWLPRRWIIQTVITVIIPETPALDGDGHRAHRDDVDCDHDHDADDQPRRCHGLTLDCQFRGTGRSTGAARAELSEEARRG
jgi:hypothetical protein